MKKSNALILLYPGCIYFEIAAAVSLLSDDCNFTFVSRDGGLIADAHGLKILTDKKIEDIVPAKFDVILVPGGDIGSTLENTRVDEFLLCCAQSSEMIIGGICNGALLLAKSGALDGKKCTHTAVEKYIKDETLRPLLNLAQPSLKKIHFIDENVVTDGRFVTAKPWASTDFAIAVLNAAKTNSISNM